MSSRVFYIYVYGYMGGECYSIDNVKLNRLSPKKEKSMVYLEREQGSRSYRLRFYSVGRKEIIRKGRSGV